MTKSIRKFVHTALAVIYLLASSYHIAKADQPQTFDLTKLTCKGYLNIFFETYDLHNDPKTQNIRHLWFEANLVIILFVWADGYLSSSLGWEPEERMVRNIKQTSSECTKKPDALFLNVVRDIFDHEPLINERVFSLIHQNCRTFIAGFDEKMENMVKIIWVDGFFSKKETFFNLAKLEKLTDDLLKECPKQPNREVLSLMRELGAYQQ